MVGGRVVASKEEDGYGRYDTWSSIKSAHGVMAAAMYFLLRTET